MKKYIKALLTITATIALFATLELSASAADILVEGSCGETATWELDTDYTLTIKGEGAIKAYSYDSFPWYTFSPNVKKIIVEDGITCIPEGSFRGCTSVEEMVLPFVGKEETSENILAVLGYVFGVRSRDTMTLSSSADIVDWEPKSENSCVYQYYSWQTAYSGGYYEYTLVSYYIPSSLRKVTITKDVTISAYAFRNCYFLEEIDLSDEATGIGQKAFEGCTGLASVSFTDSLEKIGSTAFSSTSLLDVYFTGSRNSYLGISGISQLNDATVHFKDSGSCGDSATWETTFKEELLIKGEGTVTTGTYLSYFDLVKTINIGADISEISATNFSAMTANTAYTVDEDSKNYKVENGLLLTKDGKMLIAAPINGEAVYTIPDGVEVIGESAFENNGNMAQVIIPESVITIEENAFKNCSLLTEVTFEGTERTWNSIDIATGNSLNDVLFGKFVVSYDLNTGTGDFAEQIKNRGEELSLHGKIPEKTGYTFLGWSTEKDGGVAYNAGAFYTIESDVTLYAVWEINKYDVTYNANGGQYSLEKQTKIYDVDLELSEMVPTRTGYTFNGWATSVDGDVEYNTGDMYRDNEPIELYAVWSANHYTITYLANSGTGEVPSEEHIYDVSKELAANVFTKTGYTFTGWATSSSGNVAYGDGESIKNLSSVNGANVTLYAVWEANTYTVTYYPNGGNGQKTKSTHTYDVEKALTANTFSKIGHTFKGWAADADGTVVYTDKQNVKNLIADPNGNIDLYAVWQINTYTISYNANGGSGAPKSQIKTYGVSLELSDVIPVRKGYTFVGWATSATGNAVYKPQENFVNNAAVTLYAVWKANEYEVSYNANGGNGTMANTVHIYDVEKELAVNVFTKTGYTFKGWATSGEGTVVYFDGESVENLTTVDGDKIELYAVWQVNNYTISYNANGGSGSMPSSVHIYDVDEALSKCTFTKPGYTFTGWATSVSGNVAYSDMESVKNLTEMSGTTVTLYAVWEANSYIVRYDANGGVGTIEDATHTYDVSEELAANVFTKTGYTFSGWATTPSGIVKYSDREMIENLTDVPKETVTLYAVWEANKYAITYLVDGEEYKSYELAYGEAITPEAEPEKNGYIFSGWSEIPETMPAENVTITGTFEEIEIVDATGVELNKTTLSLAEGKSETLTATVLPVDATNKNVTWKSSNTNVASVINGVVTAKSVGTATITATTVDGGYKATCEVTVTESVDPMIYVSDVRARLGQTFEVTVWLKNNPGFGGLAYDVFYDNEVITLVSYETDLGKDICTSSAIDRYENKVNFQYASANEIEGDGELVTLTFTVKEDAPTGITEIKVVPEEETFFGYEGYEEIVYILLAKDGSVEIVEYTPGDINDDGNVNNRDAARILQHLAGWDVEYVEPALDVNGDGKVNNRDAARLLQYLAGWDVEIH